MNKSNNKCLSLDIIYSHLWDFCLGNMQQILLLVQEQTFFFNCILFVFIPSQVEIPYNYIHFITSDQWLKVEKGPGRFFPCQTC